jgi:hypothetical protein
LDELNSLSEQHLLSPEVILVCGHNMYYTGTQDVVIPDFSVPNIIKTGKRIQCLARVWNWPQEFT